MLPTEQGKFFDVVSAALGAYAKFPSQPELEAWWRECKPMTLEAMEAALKSHKADPDRGERAPRPADITRRMKTGKRDAARCSCTDPTGQCEYPGIFSDGTGGEGPWFCPWHRLERQGPEASRWIEVSRNVPWEEAQAKRTSCFLAESQRAPGVVNTAHAMALRNGRWPKFQSPPQSEEAA